VSQRAARHGLRVLGLVARGGPRGRGGVRSHRGGIRQSVLGYGSLALDNNKSSTGRGNGRAALSQHRHVIVASSDGGVEGGGGHGFFEKVGGADQVCYRAVTTDWPSWRSMYKHWLEGDPLSREQLGDVIHHRTHRGAAALASRVRIWGRLFCRRSQPLDQILHRVLLPPLFIINKLVTR
jgi:hypothetical protein